MQFTSYLVALVISLFGSINPSAACQNNFMDYNPRSWDEKIAKDILSNFMIMCAKDNSNVYESPINSFESTPRIQTLRSDIKPENYMLINLWQDSPVRDETHGGIIGVCYWLLIPISLQEKYRTISQHLRAYIKSSNKNSDAETDPPSLQEQATEDQLFNFLKGWMFQDQFERSVKVGASDEQNVSFTSFFNAQIHKVMYLGITFTKPSWIGESSSTSSSTSESFSTTESDEEHSNDEYETSTSEESSISYDSSDDARNDKVNSSDSTITPSTTQSKVHTSLMDYLTKSKKDEKYEEKVTTENSSRSSYNFSRFRYTKK